MQLSRQDGVEGLYYTRLENETQLTVGIRLL